MSAQLPPRHGNEVVQTFVEQDDEFDEVGIGLLPEWFFAFPKQSY
jgi:hypothetical protein